MRRTTKNILSLLFAALLTLTFTTVLQAEAFKSPSIGGATGLISTPTSHTGWEGSGLGLDLGYHYLRNHDANGSDEAYHIPKALLHIGAAGMNMEVGFAYDEQPDWDSNTIHDDETDDMLINAKLEFTEGLAIGGNAQLIDINGDVNNDGSTDDERHDFQLYLAATYPGNFFSMPAETTLVIGHTFYGKRQSEHDNDNIDFSMGFDLDFAPTIFKNYVHLICDFSNYSYSTEAGGAVAEHRGAFNTGLRLAVLRDKKLKLNFDLIMTDALDHNRDWAAGAAFGLAI